MSLIKKLSTYALFAFVDKALFFLLPTLLTFYLTPADLGVVANFGILISVVTILITMGTHGAIGVEFYKDEFKNFPTYLSSGIINMFFSALIFSVLFFLFNRIIADYTHLPESWLLLVPMIALFTGLFSVSLSVFQVKQEAFKYGVSSILKTVIYFSIGVGLIVLFDFNYVGIMWGALISSSAIGIGLIFYLLANKIILLKFDKLFSKDILSFGLPMIPHLLGFMLIHYSDRIFISRMLSLDELGIYHVGYSIAMGMSLLITIFNKAWLPFFYELLKKGDKKSLLQIKKVSLLFIALMLVAAIVLSLISPLIFDLFISKDYASGIIYVPWVAFSFLLSSIYFVFSNFIVYEKKMKFFMYITSISAITNLILNYFMILEFGGIGAAYATFITFIILAFLMIYVAVRNSDLTMQVVKVRA